MEILEDEQASTLAAVVSEVLVTEVEAVGLIMVDTGIGDVGVRLGQNPPLDEKNVLEREGGCLCPDEARHQQGSQTYDPRANKYTGPI